MCNVGDASPFTCVTEMATTGELGAGRDKKGWTQRVGLANVSQKGWIMVSGVGSN